MPIDIWAEREANRSLARKARCDAEAESFETGQTAEDDSDLGKRVTHREGRRGSLPAAHARRRSRPAKPLDDAVETEKEKEMVIGWCDDLERIDSTGKDSGETHASRPGNMKDLATSDDREPHGRPLTAQQTEKRKAPDGHQIC